MTPFFLSVEVELQSIGQLTHLPSLAAFVAPDNFYWEYLHE